MSVTLTTAIVAFSAFGLATALPRKWTFLLAGALAVAAAATRVHGAGAGVVALVAGGALVWARADCAALARRSAAFGLACAAAALLSAPPAPGLHLGPLVLASAAPLVAALALTAALRDEAARRPLALLLALLPFPVAAVAPAHAELAVAFDDAVGAWGLRHGLAFSRVHWPAWADAVWQAGPWLLLCVVLLSIARPSPRLRWGALAVVGFTLLAAAVAQLIGALEAQPHLQGVDVGVSGPGLAIRERIALDGSAGLTVLLRVGAIAALLGPGGVQRPGGVAPVAAMSALVLLAAAAAIAPAWFGAGWMGDPAISALLLIALLAIAVSLRPAGEESRVSGLLHAALATAGLALIGGGELGWRVAGVVFGR